MIRLKNVSQVTSESFFSADSISWFISPPTLNFLEKNPPCDKSFLGLKRPLWRLRQKMILVDCYVEFCWLRSCSSDVNLPLEPCLVVLSVPLGAGESEFNPSSISVYFSVRIGKKLRTSQSKIVHCWCAQKEAIVILSCAAWVPPNIINTNEIKM